MAADAADWWEMVAKPACRIFCQKISKLLAHRRRETIFLMREALLAAADWPVVASIRSRLKEEDSYRRRGADLRARLPDRKSVV